MLLFAQSQDAEQKQEQEIITWSGGSQTGGKKVEEYDLCTLCKWTNKSEWTNSILLTYISLKFNGRNCGVGRWTCFCSWGGPEKNLRATALIQVPVCIFLVVCNIQWRQIILRARPMDWLWLTVVTMNVSGQASLSHESCPCVSLVNLCHSIFTQFDRTLINFFYAWISRSECVKLDIQEQIIECPCCSALLICYCMTSIHIWGTCMFFLFFLIKLLCLFLHFMWLSVICCVSITVTV